MGNAKRLRMGSWACASALFGAALTALAQTPDWAPELTQGEGQSFHKLGEPIVIQLPDVPADALTGLAIELDANDVTAVAEASEDGRSIRIPTQVPLEPGVHTLRVVQSDEEGNLFERGSWQFEVRQSSVFRKATLDFNPALSFDGSHLVTASEEIDGQASSVVGNGSAKPTYMTDSGTWVNAGSAELLADTNRENTGAERAVELGTFLLASGNDNLKFQAGHHFPGPVVGNAGSSLIVDGSSRRGLSATWGARGWPTNLRGFALRTDSLHGFEHGFGVGDSNNRIDGLLFDTLLYASGESTVKMGIGHVTGAGEQGGTAIGDPASGVQMEDPGQEGDASNFVLESQWAERQLTARAEAARSRRNIGFGISDIDDDAQSFMLAYTPKRGLMFGDQEMTWSAQLDHQKIGGLFRSIGSAGGAVDVEGTALSAGAQLGELSSTLSLSRSKDNVNDFPFPTSRAAARALTFAYAPQIEPVLHEWLQQPALNLSLSQNSAKTLEIPAGSNAQAVDTDTSAASIDLSFAQPYGSWGIAFTPTRFKDHTGAFLGDVRARTWTVGGDFKLSESYSIIPSVTFDRQTEESIDLTTKTRDVSLTQNFVLIKDVLSLGLRLTDHRQELSDGSQDSTNQAAALDIGWATPFMRGLSLWFSANYNRDKDKPDEVFSSMDRFGVLDERGYQAFVGFNYKFQP